MQRLDQYHQKNCNADVSTERYLQPRRSQKYVTFVEERLNKNEVNIWARMKKVKLKRWKSVGITGKHKLMDQAVEMKEDRSLLGHMLIVAHSRPEMNLMKLLASMSSLLFHEPGLQLMGHFY